MKRLFLVLPVLAFSCMVFAQTSPPSAPLRGYVLDANCGSALAGKPTAMARAARHTKACALEEDCAAAGYGIVSDGKWVKFDARGDALAKAAIAASKRERGHYVEVRGYTRGDRFVVESIKEIAEKK